MIDVETLYFGRIETKIAAAERLFLEHGARLRNIASVASALAELDVRLKALNDSMASAGFPTTCGGCAKQEPGGCCDASIAEEAYGMLLLVNLLLGVTIRRQTTDHASCIFVGPTGCTLRAKPSICWNYNCRDVRKTLLPPELERVEQLVGLALQQLLVTEEQIENNLKT